jgi:hypothetical protein
MPWKSDILQADHNHKSSTKSHHWILLSSATSQNIFLLYSPTLIAMSTFTVFPLLPVELQTQIWLHAISHSPTRLIPISVFQTPSPDLPSQSTKNNVYTSSASIPSALHACLESRCLSLKRWGLSTEEPGQLFFDVNTDILFLGHWVENGTEFSRMGEDWDRDVVDRSDTQPGMVRMADRMLEDDVVDFIGPRGWEERKGREL